MEEKKRAKNILAIQEFENPAFKTMMERVQDRNEYQFMVKELQNRIKSINESIRSELDSKGNYNDNEYTITLNKYNTTRLDAHRVREFLKEKEILKEYENTTISERLTIKRK